MEKRWIINDQTDQNEIENFSKELSTKGLTIEKPLISLLLSRGINTYADTIDFFYPKIENLHDPYLMKDMDKAVDRLSEAVIHNEKILIYGDYDVDGTSAVA